MALKMSRFAMGQQNTVFKCTCKYLQASLFRLHIPCSLVILQDKTSMNTTNTMCILVTGKKKTSQYKIQMLQDTSEILSPKTGAAFSAVCAQSSKTACKRMWNAFVAYFAHKTHYYLQNKWKQNILFQESIRPITLGK